MTLVTDRDEILTLLLKHITGHREHPSVQQQQTHPQNSHFTLTGSVFLRTALMRRMVALNSSGATRDTRPAGNCTLKRLLKPNLESECIDRKRTRLLTLLLCEVTSVWNQYYRARKSRTKRRQSGHKIHANVLVLRHTFPTPNHQAQLLQYAFPHHQPGSSAIIYIVR